MNVNRSKLQIIIAICCVLLPDLPIFTMIMESAANVQSFFYSTGSKMFSSVND